MRNFVSVLLSSIVITQMTCISAFAGGYNPPGIPEIPLATEHGGTGATSPAAAVAAIGAAASGSNSDITALTAAASIKNVDLLGLKMRYNNGSGTLALGTNTLEYIDGTYTAATLPNHPTGQGSGTIAVYSNRVDSSPAVNITTQGSDLILYENETTTTLPIGRGEIVFLTPLDAGSFTYWVLMGTLSAPYNSQNLSATIAVRRSDTYYYSTGGGVFNLPATPNKSPNRCYIYNAGTSADTINAAASEFIYSPKDGAVSSYSLLPKSGILLVSDRRGTSPNGRGWVIIAESIGTLPLARGGTGVNASATAPTFAGLSLSDNMVTTIEGKGIQIKTGSNARMGESTLAAGTVTVSNTSITASTHIFLSRRTGTLANFGNLTFTRSAAASFTIDSTNILDDSTVQWLLIEPSP